MKTRAAPGALLAFGFLLAVAQGALAAPGAEDSHAAFTRGVELMDQRQYGDAIVLLKQAEKDFPKAPPLLWNLGIASVEVGNHREALAYWRKYHQAEPGDWKALPKMVQAHQALGDNKARDRQIKDLRALRARSPGTELGTAERFCREQLLVAGRKVLVFETFEPQGPQQVFYRFAVTDDSGKETTSLSLGSYDATTQIARDMGAIPKTGRAYHLDRYEGTNHTAYAHFNSKPSYETVRKAVIEILQGKTPNLPTAGRAGKGKR